MTIHRLSRGLLFLMAVTTGLVVANNYYNQPLLGLMTQYYGVSELQISSVPMLTQIGYAVGLFLIVPLGDKFKRKKLILTDFFLIFLSLLWAANAPNILHLKLASFFIGLTSVVPQIMVPMAAQLADGDRRGAAIGSVMTGMFIGILGSRTLSGFIGSHQQGRGTIYKSDGRTRSNPEYHYGTGGLLQGRKYMITTSWNAPEGAFTIPGEIMYGFPPDKGVLYGFHIAMKFVGLSNIQGMHFYDVAKGLTSERLQNNHFDYLEHLKKLFGK